MCVACLFALVVCSCVISKLKPNKVEKLARKRNNAITNDTRIDNVHHLLCQTSTIRSDTTIKSTMKKNRKENKNIKELKAVIIDNAIHILLFLFLHFFSFFFLSLFLSFFFYIHYQITIE